MCEKKNYFRKPRWQNFLETMPISDFWRISCFQSSLSLTVDSILFTLCKFSGSAKEKREREKSCFTTLWLLFTQIRLHEVVETTTKVYIVLQLASKGDLLEYVNNNPTLSEDEVRMLFCQLAAAMAYCHKEQVVHRDLKCENILLDKEGRLKVTGTYKMQYTGTFYIIDCLYPSSLSHTKLKKNNMQQVSSARRARVKPACNGCYRRNWRKQTLRIRRPMPSVSNVESNMHRTTAEKGRKKCVC